MLTRRKFLGTTIGAGVALATGACATQPAGKRVIVDAQVHLWKANGPDYPWNPGAKPQLPEPFTVERVVPLMDEAGVDRVVVPGTYLRRRDCDLRTRIAQQLNLYLSKITTHEDEDLVQRMQIGLGNTDFRPGPLSLREKGVAWFAGRIRTDLGDLDEEVGR